MKVIGIIGLIGSGKDVVSDYLSEKYGYSVINMGDILRDIASRLGRSHERHDLTRTQKEVADKYGVEVFGEVIVKRIKHGGADKVVINGIRRPEDAIVPKKEFGHDMLLVLVNVSPRLRYGRMKRRRREGDPKSFKEFMEQEKSEFKSFRLDETLKLAEVKIKNNSTKEHVYKQIDSLLKEKGFL